MPRLRCQITVPCRGVKRVNIAGRGCDNNYRAVRATFDVKRLRVNVARIVPLKFRSRTRFATFPGVNAVDVNTISRKIIVFLSDVDDLRTGTAQSDPRSNANTTITIIKTETHSSPSKLAPPRPPSTTAPPLSVEDLRQHTASVKVTQLSVFPGNDRTLAITSCMVSARVRIRCDFAARSTYALGLRNGSTSAQDTRSSAFNRHAHGQLSSAVVLCSHAKLQLLRSQPNQRRRSSPLNPSARLKRRLRPMLLPTPTRKGAARSPVPPKEPPITFNSVHVDGPYIAMTFDDGPSATLTPKLLDILAAHHIKATFFVLGEMVAEHPEILARAVREGHEIASHSWSHPNLAKMSQEGVRSQLQRTDDAIKSATGKSPTLFRPPYGSITEREKRWIHDEFGYDIILWDVDPLDWKRPGPAVVRNRILKETRPGSIVLSHDIHPEQSRRCLLHLMNWTLRVSNLSPCRSCLTWQHRRRPIRRHNRLRKRPRKPLHLLLQHLLQADKSVC